LFAQNSTISLLVLLLAGLTLQGPVAAQQARVSEKDSARAPQSGIYPLPIFFYTPETKFAGGAAVLFLYRDSVVRRASSITGNAIYTQKKQVVASCSGDLYFANGRTRFLGELTFQKYPNRFFGVGNETSESSEETYTPQTFLLRAVLYKNISSNINIGPALRYEHLSMRETASGGLLRSSAIPGSNGGVSAGIGFVSNWDSRDNTFSARSGSFCQLTFLMYRSAFGSDYNYMDIQIDTRTFIEPFPEHVVAVQAGGEFIDGTVPFHSLVRFGGQSLLRGYYDGRYRDKNGVAVQAEYRLPVWWRFGAVGFMGAAQVADRIGRFSFDQFWVAGGVGVRFALNPEERINLRLDYGVGKNSSGLYITITEAF
jgi:outer membrane protein assembly factor BamA